MGTDSANELHLDARVFQAFAVFWSNGDRSFDRFAIHVQRGFFPSILVKFHVHHSPIVRIVQDDVNVDRCRKEIRHSRGGLPKLPRSRKKSVLSVQGLLPGGVRGGLSSTLIIAWWYLEAVVQCRRNEVPTATPKGLASVELSERQCPVPVSAGIRTVHYIASISSICQHIQHNETSIRTDQISSGSTL